MASPVLFGVKIWPVVSMVILIFFYGLSFIDSSVLYCAITVARVLPPHYWFWTLFTFSFFNDHLLHVLFDMATVYLVDVVMFPSWHLAEVIRCCVLAQLFSSGLVVCTLFLGYACTFDLDLLWTTPICGLSPLLGAALVVARQLTPDNVLANLPLGKFRTKHIAFTMFFCFLILAVLHVTDYVHFMLLTYGALVTWVYLRFFQRHSNGDIGDTTDAFDFSGFFPNHLEPPIAIVSNAIYSLLVKLRICKDRRILDTDYCETTFAVRVVDRDDQRPDGDPLLPKVDAYLPEHDPLEAFNESGTNLPANST